MKPFPLLLLLALVATAFGLSCYQGVEEAAVVVTSDEFNTCNMEIVMASRERFYNGTFHEGHESRNERCHFRYSQLIEDVVEYCDCHTDECNKPGDFTPHW